MSMNSVARAAVVLLSIACVAACVPAVDMSDANSLPSSSEKNGAILKGNIQLKRSAERGGSNDAVVGKVRGGYGNPFTVKAKQGKELMPLLQGAADAAIGSAGYIALPAGSQAPRLEIDVLDFWCDGYVGYKVNALLDVRVMRGDTVLAEKKVDVSQGFAIVAGYGPMHDAYDKTMARLTRGIADFLSSDEVKRALQSSSIASASR